MVVYEKFVQVLEKFKVQKFVKIEIKFIKTSLKFKFYIFTILLQRFSSRSSILKINVINNFQQLNFLKIIKKKIWL